MEIARKNRCYDGRVGWRKKLIWDLATVLDLSFFFLLPSFLPFVPFSVYSLACLNLSLSLSLPFFFIFL